MTDMAMISTYRAAMFDGPADIAWLHQGWRGLRQYGRRAKAAIEANDIVAKAEAISRADQLLNLLTGILDAETGAGLCEALMTIYTALRFCLLRANAENSLAALADYETALALLDRDMTTGNKTDGKKEAVT